MLLLAKVGPLETDEPLERRKGFVSTVLPVCRWWRLAESDPGGGVMFWRGAKVDLKCELRPVSSLGSGSIKGSIKAWCACEVSRLRLCKGGWLRLTAADSLPLAIVRVVCSLGWVKQRRYEQ